MEQNKFINTNNEFIILPSKIPKFLKKKLILIRQ
ncbi:MAG: hypothetical protein Ct9H90mP3_0930 [Flammeovirgaceae bacterium]|nr:MAG: hypothetical protein Ct9H90mP3_0930 [Flammeovirgaceae bacterium]